MTFVWWSAVGASEGKPWRVMRNGETQLFADVEFQGKGYTLTNDDGFKNLPDGPRGILVVCGEVVAK